MRCRINADLNALMTNLANAFYGNSAIWVVKAADLLNINNHKKRTRQTKNKLCHFVKLPCSFGI